MILTRFLDLILGALIAAPQILEPHKNIPLIKLKYLSKSYQAAPATDIPIAKATPIVAQKNGDIQ